MGVPGPRTKHIDGSTLIFGEGCYMSIDICGRVSKCRICERPITAGQRRVVLTRTTIGRKMVNGGVIRQTKHFNHPACFQAYITKFTAITPEEATKEYFDQDGRNSFKIDKNLVCLDCGDGVAQAKDDGSISRSYYARVSGRYAHERICIACVESGRWQMCHYCGSYVKKYSASELLDPLAVPMPEPGEGHYACDLCAENNNLKTRKKENSELRRKEKENKRFEAFRASLEEKYAQKDRQAENSSDPVGT